MFCTISTTTTTTDCRLAKTLVTQSTNQTATGGQLETVSHPAVAASHQAVAPTVSHQESTSTQTLEDILEELTSDEEFMMSLSSSGKQRAPPLDPLPQLLAQVLDQLPQLPTPVMQPPQQQHPTPVMQPPQVSTPVMQPPQQHPTPVMQPPQQHPTPVMQPLTPVTPSSQSTLQPPFDTPPKLLQWKES